MSILEGSWRRSIRTVSYPATKFRHGRRLSCCDGHGLRISIVNPADKPRWEDELAQPSFACVLLQVCVFHPPRFRLTSTRARRFLHPFGRATALQLRGLPLALITFFAAAVRWCGANGGIATRRTGRWGCAASVLLLIGLYSTGTMGCTMRTPSTGFFWFSFFFI